MSQQARNVLGGDLADAGEGAIEIGGLAGMAPDPIVDQRVSRPGIERQDLVIAGPDPRDIADPAEIEHGDRLRQIGGQGGMVERRQGRSLPARRHIGAAEIGDDVDAGEARERGSIADLPSAALGRAVQDRVAVEPDELDRHIRMAPAKLSNCGGMQPGQLSFDRCNLPDPAQHRTQPVAERLGVGNR